MEKISVNKNKLKSDIEPVVLSQTSTTRVVLKGEKFPDSGLRLKLVHQKGSKLWEHDTWEDEQRFKKASLKTGEFVDFELDTEQTKKLIEALPKLQAISDKEISSGYNSLAIADADNAIIFEGREKEIFQKLIDETGNEFWEILEELNPGAVDRVALLKEHKKREEVLNIFKENLIEQTWDEPDWQKFFDNNKWIFGSGLDYRILDPITNQPHYGRTSVKGTGRQRGDNLYATRANTKFTVLVEIKKPQSELIKGDYRNGTSTLGIDLIGGVSQLQINCRSWVRFSEEEQNRDLLEPNDIHTCEPEGILIIGDTKQLNKNRNYRNTFELFRRNLNNPKVMTFDELYEKAKFIVSFNSTDKLPSRGEQ